MEKAKDETKGESELKRDMKWDGLSLRNCTGMLRDGWKRREGREREEKGG